MIVQSILHHKILEQIRHGATPADWDQTGSEGSGL